MTQDARLLYIEQMMAGSGLDEQYKFIHPDCVVSHPPVLQYGGTKIGPDGMKSIIDGLFSHFDMEVARTETHLIGDDMVLQLFVDATFINKKSGRRHTMNVAEIYRFENGLCVAQDNFYKSPEVIAEMIAEAG